MQNAECRMQKGGRGDGNDFLARGRKPERGGGMNRAVASNEGLSVRTLDRNIAISKVENFDLRRGSERRVA